MLRNYFGTWPTSYEDSGFFSKLPGNGFKPKRKTCQGEVIATDQTFSKEWQRCASDRTPFPFRLQELHLAFSFYADMYKTLWALKDVGHLGLDFRVMFLTSQARILSLISENEWRLMFGDGACSDTRGICSGLLRLRDQVGEPQASLLLRLCFVVVCLCTWCFVSSGFSHHVY